MIRPSEELKAVIRRWHNAILTKDKHTLTNMLSRSEHLRYQGTAEGEEWAGQVFRRGFPDHVSEIPDFTSREVSLEAFEHGAVGWGHFHAELTFHSTQIPSLHRFTFVLTLEDGAWRIVQIHVSNPTSNIDKMGVEHQALDELIRAAREAFRLEQKEGVATIMFTDIAGFTATCENLSATEVADFSGSFYRLEGARALPKPLQQPHPPIIVGGTGEKRTLRVAALWADEWNLPGGDPDVLRHKVGVLHQHCAEVGRDPSEIEVSTKIPADGDPGALAELVWQLREAGAGHIIAMFEAPFDPADLGVLAGRIE